jgi:hypothetical protein
MLNFIPFNDILTVFNTTGDVDDYGTLVTAETESKKCHIWYTSDIENITDGYGVDNASDCVITLNGKQSLRVSDYVQIVDMFGNLSLRKILSIDYPRDLGGNVMATVLKVGIGRGFQKPIYCVRPTITYDSEGCQVSSYDYGDYIMLNIQPNITKLHNNIDGVNTSASMYAYCKQDTDVQELDKLFVYTSYNEGKPDYLVRGIQKYDKYKVVHLESLRR